MKINNNSDLVGFAFLFMIASVFVYSFWKYILGALALFGLGYLIKEWQRNNRGPRH